MASNADVIKEFLVSLGWKIDESGQRKFANTIALQTVKVQEFAKALEEVGEKVVHFVANIAEGLESLYFASMRTKASVANIQSLGFAARQMGSTSEAAQASLENLARFMRTNPGGEGLLHSLGIQTQQANGELRDTSDILQDVGKRLAQMPYYRANAYGQLLGIDEKTLMALRQGLGGFGDEYKDLLRTVGLDSQGAAKASHEFMNQLRGVRATIEVVALKVASAALPALSTFSQKLRTNLIQNLPWISKVLTNVIKGIVAIIGMVGQLGGRALAIVGDIIGWWDKLDASSKTLIETIGGIVLAWRVLNSAFLLSPIGIITALGAAILLLYDDYKTWKEGGKSLIDWGQWEPGIRQAKEAIKDLIVLLKHLRDVAKVDLKMDLGVADPKNAKNLLSSAAGMVHSLAGRKYGEAWQYFLGKQPAGSSSGAGGAHPEARDTPENTKKLFSGLEGQYRLPAGLIDADYAAESARGTKLDSPKGAMGPFQFMPQTAHEYGLQNPYDLAQSADAFARKISHLLQYYHGNVKKALAAYNWGEGNLDKYGLDKAPQETQEYITRILGNVQEPANPDREVEARMRDYINRMLGNAQAPDTLANAATATEAAQAPNPYSREMLGPVSNQTIDNSKQGPTISQTTNVTVNGASDPKRTAQLVSEAQSNVNQLLIRNTRALAY